MSSHSDSENDGGGILLCSTEEDDPSTAARMLSVYSTRGSDGLPPHTLPLVHKLGQRIIEYEENIPDVLMNRGKSTVLCGQCGSYRGHWRWYSHYQNRKMNNSTNYL